MTILHRRARVIRRGGTVCKDVTFDARHNAETSVVRNHGVQHALVQEDVHLAGPCRCQLPEHDIF